jgi:hypothetical protein
MNSFINVKDKKKNFIIFILNLSDTLNPAS